ncbi:phospholipid carrier-dependent glycosyltransferase [Dehalogenimonas alkenigignens]|uniref:Dolichyl-phosphate-mannose-protein mannosyltransferase n=1 Tax=Dehalogenimonas alkenigignens TaxID=1217799 RepID=A0A0W0GH36_9CHLR|nr:phospholipid carrier-dependent glycosyltransferase [Dehalogenimonas alkenigignens]KTB47863.1 Dolichyl-phosphate-mannose-protein mannosyltransferase [Dehalogenimonas alkenigignens]PVV83940.1 phospholipid carrier-dependent glycosyltransferase [Dehalogenimonas alkenigignens]
MTKFFNIIKRFTAWKYAWLAAVLIGSMILHLGLLWHPDELVLDEQYYVVAARDYLVQGDLHQPEHPPLAKLVITAGMQVFGDNPFGWRFFPAVFGTGAIFFFYLILRQFPLSNAAVNIAVGLFAFENATFLMASVAMLDIFNVTFMLAGFWAYLARKYPLAVLFLLLSALCKLTGLFPVIAIASHWLVFRRDKVLVLAISGLAAYAGAILAVPGLEYLLTDDWSNPFSRINHLFTVPGTITFENSSHPSALHPWQWVLGYYIMPFWWSPQYLSAVTPTVWAMTLPGFVWTSWLAWRRRDETAFFAAAWIFATLIVWIILGAITDRITYIFYFVPIVGGVLLAFALFFDKAWAWTTEAAPGVQKSIPAGADTANLEPITVSCDENDITTNSESETEGAHPVLTSKPKWWTTVRRRRLFFIGMGILITVHLAFFLALSPFTNWWPTNPG